MTRLINFCSSPSTGSSSSWAHCWRHGEKNVSEILVPFIAEQAAELVGKHTESIDWCFRNQVLAARP